jgi:DNA processing protein
MEEEDWDFLPFEAGNEDDSSSPGEEWDDEAREETGQQAEEPHSDADSTTPHSLVRNMLQTTPVTIDEVVRATGLTARAVTAALIELELAGIVERHGLQLISLRKD